LCCGRATQARGIAARAASPTVSTKLSWFASQGVTSKDPKMTFMLASAFAGYCEAESYRVPKSASRSVLVAMRRLWICRSLWTAEMSEPGGVASVQSS
jgi:hypothetical protein